MNWTFNDVVAFLKQHFFIELAGRPTGHRFYKGLVDKVFRQVEVQFHPNDKTITPRSLQHDIIPKSGIPAEYWKRYGNGDKRVVYKGAEKF